MYSGLTTQNLLCFICSVKVLIIHQHFRLPAEGGAIRSYYLARALVEKGIHVEVITAGTERISHQQVEGISVHYLPVAYDNKFGFWKRGVSFLQFARKAVALASRIPNINLCYAISVPLTTGISAMWLKMRYRLPYIFEVGDLWPDAPIELGFVKSPIIKSALRNLERASYRNASAIVALSEPIKESIEFKSPGKPVYVIPNMADTIYFGSSGGGSAFRQKHDLSDKFVISYIGAVGFANGLDHVIECARSAEQASLPVQFFICGEGALLNQHKENAKRLGLRKLEFLDFTDRPGVKELMDATDAVFVSYKPYRILETGSPNKYFDGLAAGKLILLNFEGWIKEEVERERCGVYIDRMHPDKFASIIAPILKDPSFIRRCQLAARELALRRYSRTELGEQFVRLISGEVENKN
jgi:glycosyltransferase involved in cell wall biosynthesis